MALYRFWLRENGEDYAQQVDHELADDLQALRTAKALSVDFDVEVTRGGRNAPGLRPNSTVSRGALQALG
jgi:hypothetical protein